jgi:hypothetical protein
MGHASTITREGFFIKTVWRFVNPNGLPTLFAKTSLFFTQDLKILTGQVWCTRIYLEKYIHLSAQAEKTRGCIVGYNSLSGS